MKLKLSFNGIIRLDQISLSKKFRWWNVAYNVVSQGRSLDVRLVS